MNDDIEIIRVPAGTEAPGDRPVDLAPHASRLSKTRLALAIAVAVTSDVLAFFVGMIAPMEWALDLATAVSLFLILGRRWAILPGLISEAIPGLAVFPAWILVVGSIILYDDIKGRRSNPYPQR